MRSRDQVIRDFVQQWLDKAESDLAASDLQDYFTCVFHCQQASEKFLKAYLVRHQIEFRKTHDLGQLLTLSSRVDPELQTRCSSCTWLTPFGVEFRYPNEYPEVSRATAQDALAETNAVKQAVLQRLTSYLERTEQNAGT
jgi:HEPN domain-containing protein